MGKLAILEMVLFDKPSNKQRATERVADIFKVVSIHEFWVYKAMSRPKVDESLDQSFIKVILTKDQGRSKGNKDWIGIRKSRYIESDRTHYYMGKFNMALSLYGVLGVALYFSEDFSETAIKESVVVEGWSTIALGNNHSLLFEIGAQLVVFYTIIEVHVVFGMLLILVTGQLAIAGQLRRKIYL